MTAIEQTANFFEQRGAVFAKELEYYLKFGHIYCSPERILLAREINIDKGEDEWIFNGSGNCWYVHWACGAGALDWFLEKAPYPKPYLAWRRWRSDRNDFPHLRVFKWETVSKRLLTTKEKANHGR